jgi:hypothetical protein
MRMISTVLLLIASVLVVGCSDNSTRQTLRNVGSAAADRNAPKPDMPLPDRAYKAELSLPEPLETLKAGQKQSIKVKVKNASDTLWIVYGTGPGNKYRVAVADSWLDSKGKLITSMDGRYGLPANLGPGREVEVPLVINTPATAGDNVLQLDMVQEGVAWFSEKGSPTLKVNVKVQ